MVTEHKNIKKTYCGKWILLGFSRKDYNKIRERVRSRAKAILSKKFPKEYNKIRKKILESEYNYYKMMIRKHS